MGRLVLTHSTYINGLIPKLKVLASKPAIKTVTPGIIKQTKSKASRFKLKISISTKAGYKLLARKGHSVQEVFVVTLLDRIALNNYLEE